MKKSRATKKVGDWSTHTHIALDLRKGGTALHVGITPFGGGKWFVMAATTPAKSAGDPRAVLDNHSHKVLGDSLELNEAIKVAEDFARAWQPGKDIECHCDEITIDSPAAKRVKTRNPPRRR